MSAFNLELTEIFNKFCWTHFPINNFLIEIKTLKYVDGDAIFNSGHDIYQEMNIYDRDSDYNSSINTMTKATIYDQKKDTSHQYQLVTFSKNKSKSLPIYLRYELNNRL